MRLNTILSFFVYWIAFGLMLFLSVLYIRQKEEEKRYVRMLLFVAFCLPLAVIAGLRNGVGTDYENYVRIFDQIKELSVWECLTHEYLDILFAVLIRVLLYITSNVKIIFFVIELAMVLIVFAAVERNVKEIDLPLLVLMWYLIVYHPSLNIMRQCLACSFIIWVLALGLNKKYIQAIVVGVLGTLIHNTAVLSLVFLAVLWLFRWMTETTTVDEKKKKIVKGVYYTLIVISPLLIPAALKILMKVPVFAGYAHYGVETVNVGVGQIAYMLLLTAPLILHRKVIFGDGQLCALFHVALLYFPLAFVGYYFNWASRLNIYTLMIFGLLVCMTVCRCVQKKEKICTAGWYVVLFGGWYIYQILICNWHETIPYII